MYHMPFNEVGNNSVSVNYGGSRGRAVTIDSQVVQDDAITIFGSSQSILH